MSGGGRKVRLHRFTFDGDAMHETTFAGYSAARARLLHHLAMPMTFQEACAAVCAPGTPFEIQEADVFGLPTKVFAGTPPSMRHLFSLAAARTDDFIVYEDERWTMPEVLGLAGPDRSRTRPRARRRSRRSGRDRDAQLSRVDRELRRDHEHRRSRRSSERLVGHRRDRLRAGRLRCQGRVRRRRTAGPNRRCTDLVRSGPRWWRFARRRRSPPGRSRSTNSSATRCRCPTPTSTLTTT